MTPKDAANTIRQRTTLTDVIERYTGQRPQRKRYLCPFHNDHHPDLAVKGDKWKCFSCGAAGDTISFVQMYFNLNFWQAISKISDDFGLDLPVGRDSKPNPEEVLFDEIRRESDERNRREIQRHKDELIEEIKELSGIHRVLMRTYASEELLEKCAEMIDDIQREL